MSTPDEKKILRILEHIYAYDMYLSSEKTVAPEFHPSFQMALPQIDGRTGRIADTQWIKPEPGRRSQPKALEETTSFDFDVVDITGKVAVGKVIVRMDGMLTYTDYILLMKIDGEWRMIGKMFHTHALR